MGGIIIVTDLKAAIEQVELFIELTHEDAADTPSLQRFDQQRLRYWKDMQQKLMQLQLEMDNKDKI
ncbi:MAG: hypothetical protein P0Y49_14165 [Candidatus Pedobacter colombiensis]|uniref:Uncharacterized protein n=1 Tax=Candidatus Pedobacter colombiensis TaxID=3121371 RepID=A0AAJ6B7D0_9SPHI|nr:hypothetical protein [Pedobacter sp.]WEK17943.1 MAG: hypothetical protein P0Y49_14165 [Pedobacter sp.]